MGALLATTVHVQPLDPRYAAQFVPGYHRALHVGAAILIVGAFVAAVTIRKIEHAEERRTTAEPVVGA
jgi:hypothetical protein